MTEETLAFVQEITAPPRGRPAGAGRGARALHAAARDRAARRPRLRLRAAAGAPALRWATATVDRLPRWLEIRPANAVTVLDTHDGIGIIDAGPSRGSRASSPSTRCGLSSTAPRSRPPGTPIVASSSPHGRPCRTRSTPPSPACWAPMSAYLLCRAVQLFVPGEPQIYYVGLLGGLDDVALFAAHRAGPRREQALVTIAEFTPHSRGRCRRRCSRSRACVASPRVRRRLRGRAHGADVDRARVDDGGCATAPRRRPRAWRSDRRAHRPARSSTRTARGVGQLAQL